MTADNVFSRRTGALAAILIAGFPFFVSANQITVNFSATYSAATCLIEAPASVSFNQGEYSEGVPVSAIQGDAVSQDFTLKFSDCKNISAISATPGIRVEGTTVTLGNEALFSDNTGLTGEAIGYGVRLSTAGNSWFQATSNLAANNTLLATTGTSIENINNQQLDMKAVLTCGQQDCSDMTTRKGGTFVAKVTFRLYYE